MGERTDAAAADEPSLRCGTSRTSPSARPIKAGDLLRLGRTASVQFCRPITVRVIREIEDLHTYDGWAWLEAYELNAKGDAVAKRELFVWLAGLHRVDASAGQGAAVGHRVRTATRPRVPA
ncbi:hypothetical protein O7622_24665 [Micromonospora sp. WMMD1076]|uniref:hypothetical protein n=1 Tax=Micromonospora sp. WMMD1076 TaxID=3016103 RepID=UPI00249BCE4F|nr:hypothetical protein [Micromonospora sp. WMMD1076]WFF06218.1 hypothetical protein O7622_24665 [Micromonospora sp. WMMD1076]